MNKNIEWQVKNLEPSISSINGVAFNLAPGKYSLVIDGNGISIRKELSIEGMD